MWNNLQVKLRCEAQFEGIRLENILWEGDMPYLDSTSL